MVAKIKEYITYAVGLSLSLSVIFSFEASGQSACFSSLYDYSFPGASNAQCITHGDFDEDGKEDVIIGVFLVGSNNLRFLKGNGDGTFAAPVSFDVGSRPLALVAYDFNQDSHLDLAVANNNTHVVSIAFGNGNGTFNPPTTYSTPSGPNGLALGDFNGDSRMDIIVTSLTTGFYLMTGNVTPGTFTVSPVFSVAPGTAPRSVTVGDFNGDTFLDVATANASTANITVRLGDGAGNFAAGTTFAAGTSPFSIVSGDMDGDSDIDIAVSNSASSNITVFINNGSAVFSGTNYTAQTGPNAMVCANLNGDASMDLALVNDADNSVSVFTATGTGTFNPQVVFPSVATPKSLTFFDFDGDSKLDLVYSSNVATTIPAMGLVSIMLGDGAAGFSTIAPVASGTTTLDVASGDFDEDGTDDIVSVNNGSSNFGLSIGNGDGTFQPAVFTGTNVGPKSIGVADFNNDNHLDVCVITHNGGTKRLNVFLGTGTGTFGPLNNTNINTITQPWSVQTAKIDADAFTDVVIVDRAGNQVWVALGNGSGGFGALTSYAVNSTPTSVVLGKFNNDANIDMAVCNKGSNNITVRLGSGGGAFGAASTYTIGGGTGPIDIASGDFNNDGFGDLVVADSTSNNIAVLLNSGTGTFPTASTVSSNANPLGVTVGDFNKDNAPDIAVTCNITANTSGTVDVFMNSGTGTFSHGGTFATRLTPRQITTGNFNGDIMPDLAVANLGNNQANILINTTPFVTASGPLNFCTGGSVTLSSSLASSYLWSTSATSQNINVTSSGIYNVTTNNSFSSWCSATSANDTVTVTPAPTVSGVSGSTTICNGSSTTLTASSGAGSPVFTWYDAPTGGTLLQTGASYTTPSLASNTTYWVEVTDVSSGCVSSSRFQVDVVVQDLIPPVISGMPANISVNTSPGLCDAVVSWTAPTGSDNCTLVSLTPDIASGSVFPLGTTTVTYTATDGASNTSTASFNVTVTDNINPTISGTPSNITVSNSAGLCSAVVSWTAPTASDNCSVASLTPSQASGTSFPVGTTTVTYTALDGSGNSATSNFTVTVNDTENPVISNVPANINVNATAGLCSAVVTWAAATASDNCGVSSLTPSQASGTSFPVGTTTVTYTATDVNGNMATASFTVTVVDVQPPTISGMPANITQNATNGGCFKNVTWTAPTANDNCSGVMLTSNFSPGSSFPVGTTTVTYTATDASGNVTTSSFTITIVDNQNPYYTAFPSNISTVCDPGLCSAVVTWSATAPNDNCGIQSETATANSGDVFPVGTTMVTYTLTDVNGNVITQSFNVTVIDNIAPTFTSCPSAITACSGDTITFTTPVATDNCSGVTVTQTAGLPSGTVFPNGTTLCTFKATDASGNITNCNFNVTVNANPTVTFFLTDDFHCFNHPQYTLAGGSPAGGVYSGPGVTGAIFDPASVAVGIYTLTYTYTAANGCVGEATDDIEVSQCIGVPEGRGEATFRIYPNPNKGEFTVEIPQGYDNGRLNVLNQVGATIYGQSINMSGNLGLSLNDLAPGMYLVQLISSAGETLHSRLIVE